MDGCFAKVMEGLDDGKVETRYKGLTNGTYLRKRTTIGA